MKNSARVVTILVVAMLVAVACGKADGDGENGATGATGGTGSAAAIDLAKPCEDPLGDPAQPADDIQLSADEIAQIQQGGYSAALTWAGSGPWYEAADRGFNDALTELGIERVASASAEYDTAKQAADVENAMALDPDIVLGSPVDAVAAAEAYRPVVDAGKVLVLSDNIPDGYQPGQDYVGFVAGDRCVSGQLMADLMAEAVGGDGKIGMIFYDADYFVTNILDDYFRAAIAQKYPDIEIVSEMGFATESGTQDLAAAMILQNPDLEGIYVTWSVAAQGVIAALREADRPDIKVITHDLDATNDVDMAQGGNLYGVAVEVVYDIGYRLGMEAGYGLLGKEAPPYAAVKMMVVTKDNLAEAYQEVYHSDPPPEVTAVLGG